MYEKRNIGIIGGAGSGASALFYRLLMEECLLRENRPFDELHLIDYPFIRGLRDQESKYRRSTLREQLQYCVDALQSQGVKEAVLVCNTLHTLFDEIDLRDIHFHSLPKRVSEKLLNDGHQKALLLGTETTVRDGLYQNKGFELVLPDKKGQEIVNEVIDRILKGKILSEDASLFTNLIEKEAHEHKLQAVILGCTDLLLLHDRYSLERGKDQIYDSIQIGAKSFYRYLQKLEEEKK